MADAKTDPRENSIRPPYCNCRLSVRPEIEFLLEVQITNKPLLPRSLLTLVLELEGLSRLAPR